MVAFDDGFNFFITEYCNNDIFSLNWLLKDQNLFLVNLFTNLSSEKMYFARNQTIFKSSSVENPIDVTTSPYYSSHPVIVNEKSS